MAAAGLQNGLDLRQQVRAGRDVVRETVARYYLQPSSGDILDRLTFCWDAAGFLLACVYVRVWFVAFLAWA